MKLKSKLAALTSALLFAGISYAGQQQIECPSIDLIKSEGISMAEELGQSFFVAYHLSQYNTDQSWGFGIFPIEAQSADSALELANGVLSEMNTEAVKQVDQEGSLFCLYETGNQELAAIAMLADQQGGNQFRKFKFK